MGAISVVMMMMMMKMRKNLVATEHLVTRTHDMRTCCILLQGLVGKTRSGGDVSGQ